MEQTSAWKYDATGATAARWPAAFAPLAFGLGLIGTVILGGLVLSMATLLGARGAGGTSVAATLAQDGAFLAAIVFLARIAGPVRPSQFGLVDIPTGRAIGWTVAAIVGFYAFALGYGALIGDTGEQGTLDALGTDRSTALLIATALLVIVVAPYAEELFFRGFAYRALRNRYGAWTATAFVGIVFGSIHYGGPDTLATLPVLAVLGATFCVLYERTGSLYPAIALHVINNAIALASTADSSLAPLVSFAVGVAVLGLCCRWGLRRRDAPAIPLALRQT